MNSVALIGRLTRDPEVRYTPTQKAVVRFSVAVQRDKDSADFPNVIAWEKTAELIGRYCKKGDMIGLQGRIQTGSYEDKDGRKVYTTDVVATRVEFLTPKDKTDSKAEDDAPIDFATLNEAVPF